jgi:nicotinate-nucleotide pyrophosphorylase (carboxylating)
MTSFDPPPSAIRAIVAIALAEDLGVLGDITSIACIAEDAFASARFVSREDGVLAGTAAAKEVFMQIDPSLDLEWTLRDGEPVPLGTAFGTVGGSLRSILAGERVALNLLQHCSGIATMTRRYVRATHGKARVRDTRKTLPGLRSLEKAAVRAGGGFNHRDSLSDAVLIKDNHLAALGVTKAIERARSRWPGRIVEIECDTAEQVDEALDAGADFLLLDNMTVEDVRAVVKRVDGAAQVEVSGGVSHETVGAYAGTGADYISIGALTHSARALDIGLDIVA